MFYHEKENEMGTSIKNYGSISNAQVEYQGQTRTLKEWTVLLNLDYTTVRMRYTRGKTGAELFHATSVKPHEKLKFKSMPAILQLLDVGTRLKLVEMTDGDNDRMYALIAKAVHEYLN